MTWGIVAWSGLILGLTVVQMLMTATKNCSSFDLDDADCIRIEVNGRSAAVAEWLVRGVVIWIIGFGVLAVIWFMTRGRNAVGGSAPAAVVSAPASVAPPAPVVSLPPEGWYPDTERPGHTRWWSGAEWGTRDDEYPTAASPTPSADNGDTSGTPVASGSPEVEVDPGPAADAEVTPSQSAEQVPAVAVAAAETSSEVVPAATTSSSPEAAPARAPARFCENCGAARSPTGRFCTACGHE